MNWSNHSLLNICDFLTLQCVYLDLKCSCKSISQQLDGLTSALIRHHITNGDALRKLDSTQLKAQLTSERRLLKFKPLYCDGGVSNRDFACSLETLWEFNGSTYSTFYKEGPEPLLSNRLAIAYFAGEYGTNSMKSTFHSDVHLHETEFVKRYVQEAIQMDKSSAFTLDFLSGDSEFYPGMIGDPVTMRTFYSKKFSQLPVPPMTLTFPYEPAVEGVALVREVCVARPLTFTGPVATLMVFVGSNPGNSVNPTFFKAWEDISTVDRALDIGNCGLATQTEGVEYVEYNRHGEADFWPLVWVHFLDLAHNHVRIRLEKPQAIAQAAAMMYTIDDRRADCNLERMQPNFDIMFVVFLGSVLTQDSH